MNKAPIKDVDMRPLSDEELSCVAGGAGRFQCPCQKCSPPPDM
jgi:hypothetical protein